MSSIAFTSFNTMLSEFVTNLADVFEDNGSLVTARDTLSGFLELSPDTPIPMDKFHEVFSGHEQMVFSKDKSLFNNISLPFLDDFDVNQALDESDEDTREAIWSFLGQLTTLTMTSKSMTPEMMTSVESITESYMKKVRNGEISEEDASNPMQILAELQNNPELKRIIDENS